MVFGNHFKEMIFMFWLKKCFNIVKVKWVLNICEINYLLKRIIQKKKKKKKKRGPVSGGNQIYTLYLVGTRV
jgi:hypothetical protein